MVLRQDMGWDRGSGLGQNNDGQQEAIRVTKKQDRVGECARGFPSRLRRLPRCSVECDTSDDSAVTPPLSLAGIGATDTTDGMYYSAMNDVFNNLLNKLNKKKDDGGVCP